MARLRRWWPVLLLAVIPIAPLWRAVFLGEAVGPFDQVRAMAPWNGPAPSQPWDVLQADGVLQFYGWRDLVFESWHGLHVPGWNPYQLAGTPLLANSQSAALYPPHILVGITGMPTGPAMALLAWLHLFWAGLGVFALTRRLGASREGGAVAGASFSLSAFMIAWVGLPSVVTTVAWIPWVLLCVFGVFGASGRLTVRPAIGLAGCSAMMLLAGHLQFAAYGLMAAGLVALWLFGAAARAKAVGRGAWRLGATALALCVGGMLAAPQLLPVLEYGRSSHRAGGPTEAGYEAFSGGALKPFELTGLVYPNLLGDPSQALAGVESSQPMSSYWPEYAKRGSNFAETAISLGPAVVLLLCFLGLAAAKRALPLLAVGLAGFLVATGTPLAKLLYFWAPGWSATGSTGRAEVLVVLAACVAAGLAIPDGEERPRNFIPLIAFGLATAISMLALQACGSAVQPLVPGLADNWAGIVKLATADGTKLALAACALCLVTGFLLVRIPRYGRPGAVALAVVVPLLLVGHLVRTGSPEFLSSRGSGSARRAFINDDWGIESKVHALMPPNTATAGRVRDLAGYDSLLHRDTVAMLRGVDGRDPAPPANGNIMFVKPSADPAKLAEAGVTEVWSLKPLQGFGPPVSQEAGVIRYRLDGPGRASTPSGAAGFVADEPERIQLTAIGPGTLTLRDRNMPGWSAEIDGRPAEVRGTTWREVELQPGSHRVVFSYIPPGLHAGLAAMTIALALCVGGWLFSRGGGGGCEPNTAQTQ